MQKRGAVMSEARLQTSMFMDNPEGLQQILEQHGALTFQPLDSGLFPASQLPRNLAKQTEMDGSWFRDNAHATGALYDAGRLDLVIPAGAAMLRVINDNRPLLDEVIYDGSERRLPIRVNGRTLKPIREQRIQHDSTGYLLEITSRLLHDEVIPLNAPSFQRVLDNQAQIIRYLKAIEYWQDADAGHWEEDHRIHASSIGVVVAGLRRTQQLFEKVDYEPHVDVQELIETGMHAFDTILAQGVTDLLPDGTIPPETLRQPPWSHDIGVQHLGAEHFFELFDVRRREQDAALLFLIEPLDILDEEQAADIVDAVERHLVRLKGVARYAGDTYWGPGFKEILKPSERTTSAVGRLDLRNQTAAGVAYSKTEAQWSLFDPILAAYWARQYAKTSNPEHRDKSLEYTDRHLSQLVLQPDGSWQWPEAYYHAFMHHGRQKFQLMPNDHTPLLWTQANSLRALQRFVQIVRKP
jgi:phosphorylase kinase alpha/beta subunit